MLNLDNFIKQIYLTIRSKLIVKNDQVIKMMSYL